MEPDDLIELGAVRGAYGVKGWIRISPIAADGTVLQSVGRWWLIENSGRCEVTIEEIKCHGESLLAKWQGFDSKEAADALTGAKVAVARSDFPALPEGEHYLSDVIGYRVVNRQGAELGTASGVRTGQQLGGESMQWLEVNAAGATALIPWVDQYIEAIETATRTINVDWQSDW